MAYISAAVPTPCTVQAQEAEGGSAAEIKPSELYARSAVLMDAGSGRILFAKNGQEEMPMASTTKIMTCILVLEEGDLTETVTVSEEAASQPEVKLGMKSGQRFRLKDLLYSLMLESHNDSAVAVAEHIAGSVQGFADMMNRKAEEIGCDATYFITPNGYQGSCAKESAEDIALNGELFLNFIATCDTLGIKDSLYYKTKDLLRHTRPYWIDPEGKIQEWMEVGLDRPKGYNKNHLSHLIGFHPGRHLIAQNNPDYIQAVKRTLELFEPESSSGGWNLAWKISFWARMRNAEKSYDFIRRSMNRLSSNLLSGGTNFQIDANMGYVAGVCEMLAQSHNLNDQGLMVIELLPALPKEWPSGHIYGLRTRGGFEIDMEWKDAQITRLVIKNDRHQGDPSIEIVMNGKRFVKQIPYHSETIII